MLVGDDIFIRGVRKGVEAGEYVYRRGELLYGRDPSAAIEISEQAVIFTMAYARTGIWPRPVRVPPPRSYSCHAGSGAGAGGAVAWLTGEGVSRAPAAVLVSLPPGSSTAEGL
jgi:hypothetical protein